MQQPATVHVQELPRQPLYRVTFQQGHVWEGYTGSNLDTIDVEVYQAWLEPATKEQLQTQQQGKDHAHTHTHATAAQHGHGQQHGDPQSVDHGDHTHEGRSVVEQNAIDLEGEDDVERSRLTEALIKVTVPALTSVLCPHDREAHILQNAPAALSVAVFHLCVFCLVLFLMSLAILHSSCWYIYICACTTDAASSHAVTVRALQLLLVCVLWSLSCTTLRLLMCICSGIEASHKL